MTVEEDLTKLEGIETAFNTIAEELLTVGEIQDSEKKRVRVEARIEKTRAAFERAFMDPTTENIEAAEDIADMFTAYAQAVGIADMRRVNKEIQRKKAEKSEKAARTDPLTQSNNRSVYHEQIDAAIDHIGKSPDADGNKSYFALVMFDLDRFKGLNDDYGHDTGDAGLQAFADILRQVTRTGSHRDEFFSPYGTHDQHGGDKSMSRLGGDEFTLIMNTRAASPEEAEAHFQQGLERINKDMEVAYFEYDGMSFPLVSSAGMHILESNDTAESAYIKADTALAEHKKTKNKRYDHTVQMMKDLDIPEIQAVEDKRASELSLDHVEDVVVALNTLDERGALTLRISPDQELTPADETLKQLGVTIVYEEPSTVDDGHFLS